MSESFRSFCAFLPFAVPVGGVETRPEKENHPKKAQQIISISFQKEQPARPQNQPGLGPSR